MKVYAVGGAVRDQLIGVQPKDIDYVVVGSTPQEMIERGFIPVGKNFPVFLHPITKSEYALARRERKIGVGYTGFDFSFSADITLEEDLLRRDLTINAMAREVDHSGAMFGDIIDPYNGQNDLKKKILRHVSSAFCEDPVRVLRVARFAARLPTFVVDKKTQALAKEMVINGEIDFLVPERIWQEMARALHENQPSRFFEVLHQIEALRVILPELDQVWLVPQEKNSHPEVECGKHIMMALDQAHLLNGDLSVRWAVLVHDLGKSLTPKYLWPLHDDHERNGVSLVKNICQRLKIPSVCRELAILVTAEHGNVHRAMQSDSVKLMNLFERCDAFRRPERFLKFLLACESNFLGRAGYQSRIYLDGLYIKKILSALNKINTKDIVKKYYSDAKEINGQIFNARLKVVDEMKSSINFKRD